MKHAAIIDKHSEAEKLGNVISDNFTFSVSECESEFAASTVIHMPDIIILNADFTSDKTAEIINSFKACRSLKNIPVLLFTSDNNCERQSELFSCGADDIMHFPLCKELIIRRINLLLSDSHTDSNETRERFCFDDIMDMVSEKKYEKGGYIVQKNDFANIYRFVMRGLERSRKNVQVLLMTLSCSAEASETEAEKDVMDLLSNAVKLCLRRGDISSICSKNQIVILLMDADDDGGHLVANRIVSNFYGECDDENFELQYDIREIDRAVS